MDTDANVHVDEFMARREELLASEHFERKVRRLHELLEYANGTVWDRTFEEVRDDVIICLEALRMRPEQQVAWNGGFVVVRDTLGYTLAVTAAGVNATRLDIEGQFYRQRRATEAQQVTAEPQLDPPSSRGGDC